MDSNGNAGFKSTEDTGRQGSKAFGRRARSAVSHGQPDGSDWHPSDRHSTTAGAKGRFVEALALTRTSILNGGEGEQSSPDCGARGRQLGLGSANLKGRKSRGAARSHMEESAPELETLMLLGRRRNEEAVVAASVAPEAVLGTGIGLSQSRENRLGVAAYFPAWIFHLFPSFSFRMICNDHAQVETLAMSSLECTGSDDLF
jgi:hypothetical protein